MPLTSLLHRNLLPLASLSARHAPAYATVSRRALACVTAALCFWSSHAPPASAQSIIWTQRAAPGPSARGEAAMTYDATRGVSVLFGGGGYVQNLNFGQTWEWNGSAWTQRMVEGPSPRDSHAMAFDATRGVTVLFGGFYIGNYLSDTWEWNGATWTQRASLGPPGRESAAMAFDAARGVCILFGGTSTGAGGAGISGQTWEWNGVAWNQRTVVGPSPRTDHAMAYDSARAVTVLFGGRTADGQFSGETWEWNGASWSQSLAGGPTPRIAHAMAYDSVRGVTLLFGGVRAGNIQLNDTWEWNGTLWRSRPAPGPTQRVSHVMAFDSARQVSVMFGGYFSNETWELGPCRSVPACPADTDCSGLIDVNDIYTFLAIWFAADPQADFNAANGINIADLFDYLTAWFAGCP